jgi:scyllo-inositol 2-dehydrogenase (NADP+)
MIQSKIIVGLVSFGMSGRIFHAPFIDINPNFELKYILERTKSNSRDQYPNAIILRNFDTLLEKQEIDLIIINSPTYLHFDMAKSALLANKHVVIEKPMTATTKEAQELIKLAKKNDLTLAVYHNKRFEGGFKTVQKLIKANQLGDLMLSKIEVHRYRPEIGPKVWKEDTFPGAGLLYDIGAHLIDQCLVLFGWPIRIDTDLQIQRKKGKVIDFFDITLHYPNFKTRIISDMLTKKPKPTFTLIGTKGEFVKYGNDPQESKLAQETIDWPKIGIDIKANYGKLIKKSTNNTQLIETEKGTYIDFYQNVSDVLKLKKDLLITPEQALDVIKIIEWILDTATITKSIKN